MNIVSTMIPTPSKSKLMHLLLDSYSFHKIAFLYVTIYLHLYRCVHFLTKKTEKRWLPIGCEQDQKFKLFCVDHNEKKIYLENNRPNHSSDDNSASTFQKHSN